MDWRRMSRLLREEGRFEDDRKLRRRVGDLVTDDAVDLLGPLDGEGPDEQLADAARRLPLLGTPEADDLADDAEELADVDDDDDGGGGWFKG